MTLRRRLEKIEEELSHICKATDATAASSKIPLSYTAWFHVLAYLGPLLSFSASRLHDQSAMWSDDFWLEIAAMTPEGLTTEEWRRTIEEAQADKKRVEQAAHAMAQGKSLQEVARIAQQDTATVEHWLQYDAWFRGMALGRAA